MFQVPSAYLITDVFIRLNNLCLQRIFNGHADVKVKAAEEACRVKRLIGALRYLYRTSSSSVHGFWGLGTLRHAWSAEAATATTSELMP